MQVFSGCATTDVWSVTGKYCELQTWITKTFKLQVQSLYCDQANLRYTLLSLIFLGIRLIVYNKYVWWSEWCKMHELNTN